MWKQASQRRDVAVPAGEGSAFEVGQAEAGFQLAVVVLDPPADLGQPDELGDRGVFGQVRQPVAGGLGRFGGHSASSQHSGRLPSAARGMRRLAGRTRIVRKWLVIAAPGLPGVILVPCRQVTGWVWPACGSRAGAR